MRFCTVPRATRNFLAREATLARALVRSSPMSWRSRSSIGGPPIDQTVLRACQYAQLIAQIGHVAGFLLAQPPTIMASTKPEKRARRAVMVDYIGVNTIQKLINAIGPG